MSFEQPGPSTSNITEESHSTELRSAIRQARKFLTIDEAVAMVLCPDVDISEEDDGEFESAVFSGIEEEDIMQHIRSVPNIEVHDDISEDDIPLSTMAEQQRS